MAEHRRQAFFATNSQWFNDVEFPAVIFAEVAQSSGFYPVHYTGLPLNVRNSNIDREVRDDFYGSQVVVLYLGQPKPGSDHRDNWALCEMKIARDRNKVCLVYTSTDFPSDVLDEYGIRDIAVPISGSDEFRTKLAASLGSIPR